MALPTPASFQFPYAPYDIQTQLMQRLFETIEHGRVGIFESPTGTGKTQSVICSALTWLERHRTRTLPDPLTVQKQAAMPRKAAAATPSSTAPAWLMESAAQIEQDSIVAAQRRAADARVTLRRKLLASRRTPAGVAVGAADHSRTPTKPKPTAETKFAESDDSDSGLDDYHSDTGASLRRDRGGDDDPFADDPFADYKPPARIIFCSRTHSQLTQFVSELRKSGHAAGDLMFVALGSRNALCVNEPLRTTYSGDALNEVCLHLQDKARKAKPADGTSPAKRSRHRTTSTLTACSFMQTGPIAALRDHSLTSVLDIEDLAKAGKEMHACPYYASRKAVAGADLIAVPYSMVLSSTTRDSVGLDLTNAVVIFDEAHNLIDAISSAHSAAISPTQLAAAADQLQLYIQRYKARLRGSNLFYCQQLLRLLTAVSEFLTTRTDKSATLLGVAAFFAQCDVSELNTFKIARFLADQGLSRKLRGFVNRQSSTTGVGAGAGAMASVEAWLSCVTGQDPNGRIIVEPVESGASLSWQARYLLLSVGAQFAPILQQARSVILVGGTMHPVSDVMGQLMRDVPPERLTVWACSHIIPRDSVLPIVVSSFLKTPLNFSFDKRAHMLDPLINILTMVVRVIPTGCVVFFPSFKFLNQFHDHLRASSSFATISAHKQLFVEPRTAGQVEAVLAAYSAAAVAASGSVHGAVLFAVVGGKMSEGINFADDMARCVIVVGMPYPNPTDPVLQERMRFLSSGASAAGVTGDEYYENLCMKAVNQSIGRSIRHVRDYAAILLVDERYMHPNIIAKLPAWIRDRIVKPAHYGEVVGALRTFVQSHR